AAAAACSPHGLGAAAGRGADRRRRARRGAGGDALPHPSDRDRRAAVIEIERLRKEYPKLVAVKDLSLRQERGDIHGVIGPNGAGKTTTIRMLATLLKPTSGSARIGGHDVEREPEKVRAIVGYMPDFFGVYDDI